MLSNYKIIYAGVLDGFSNAFRRKTILEQMGHDVTGFNFEDYVSGVSLLNKIEIKLLYGPSIYKLNAELVVLCTKKKPDILFVDKGLFIKPITLKRIKSNQPDLKIVHYNPDDPFGFYSKGWEIFKKAIPFYDLHFVARVQNITEYEQFMSPKTILFDRSFDPTIHKPYELNENEKKIYKCDVGFIGTYAPERADFIRFLIENDVWVAIWGTSWYECKDYNFFKPYIKGPNQKGIFYAKAINGMKVSLHFLRSENRDEQDSRSFEIPACGTFMLAQRSPKHEQLFEENVEAVFFESKDELLNKLNYFLRNEDERVQIAKNGYNRSINSGYDHINRLKQLLEEIIND